LRIRPKQHDFNNCGVIWCLFIHDMMQQALVPYDFKFDKKKKNLIPYNIGIGKTWIHPNLFSQFLKNDKQAMSEKAKVTQIKHEIALYKVF